MANRKLDPEVKRIPMIVTIKKNVKDKIKNQAIKEKTTMSEFVERTMQEKLDAK